METTTNREATMTAKTHTLTILANLNCGDMIVRSSLRGVRRMTRCELLAHEACGATIAAQRRRLSA